MDKREVLCNCTIEVENYRGYVETGRIKSKILLGRLFEFVCHFGRH